MSKTQESIKKAPQPKVYIAKFFRSGNSNALRLPGKLLLKDREYEIHPYGDQFFLSPVDDPWFLVRQGLDCAKGEPEFQRNQPMLSDLPEREEFHVFD